MSAIIWMLWRLNGYFAHWTFHIIPMYRGIGFDHRKILSLITQMDKSVNRVFCLWPWLFSLFAIWIVPKPLRLIGSNGFRAFVMILKHIIYHFSHFECVSICVCSNGVFLSFISQFEQTCSAMAFDMVYRLLVRSPAVDCKCKNVGFVQPAIECIKVFFLFWTQWVSHWPHWTLSISDPIKWT